MTSPTERGLFEQLKGELHSISAYNIARIEMICAEHEQQLADASSIIEDLRLIEREKIDQVIGQSLTISAIQENNQELSQQLASAREEVEGLKGRLFAQTDYSISLQRSIEHFCRGEKIPGPIAYGCQHHARMLNEKLTAPLPEKNGS